MKEVCGNCNRRDDAFSTGSGKTEYRCLFDGHYHPENFLCEHYISWAYPSLALRIEDTNRYKDQLESKDKFHASEASLDRRHKETTWTTWKVAIVCTLLGAVLGVLGTLLLQYLN